ncbi:MAG: TRAP transporter small permease [Phascolarctobacterium sp.]|uniref:TRAP transporter small permease n=1 Tax=Phascolarctobacterium sp. TaxID=2049039 RepID=UPI0026DCD254|nr:TRAP transporter small permease [Phascolarctobacterium sp.]MDO4920577.1 TRAP transporter small permease [Phascolarctobacterium sp.]
MNLKFILQNLEDIVASIFISITTVLVIINIILRYIFNSGLVWSEEVATGCFVWSVFIGAVAVFKHRGHVGVDLIVKRLPRAMQWGVRLVTDLILVALNGYMAYLSVLYIQTSYTKMTPVLGVSSAYISSSVLIAFVLMTAYSVKFVVEDLFGKKEVEA